MSQMYYSTMLWVEQTWFNLGYWIRTLDKQDWLILLAVTTCIGAFCLRGYGSRHNY